MGLGIKNLRTYEWILCVYIFVSGLAVISLGYLAGEKTVLSSLVVSKTALYRTIHSLSIKEYVFDTWQPLMMILSRKAVDPSNRKLPEGPVLGEAKETSKTDGKKQVGSEKMREET